MTKFYTNASLFKGKVLLRGYENGERFTKDFQYEPYLFISTSKPTEWHSIDGKKVDRKVFPTFNDAREFQQKYEGVYGTDIYGQEQFLYTFLADRYPGEIKYDREHIHVVNVDIEIAADKGFPDIELADKPITAIDMMFKDVHYVFGCGDFTTERADVRYFKCQNEIDLIMKFLDKWREIDPDIITGWNVESFDVPYLINRFTNMVGLDTAKRLSPWHWINERRVTVMGQEKVFKHPVGVTVLDYLALYKKFTYTMQETYKLDHIAFVELGDRKLDYSEHGSLLELYKEDYQKFIEYNIKDVEIVDRLDKKMGLIDLVFALAYDAKVNYIDSLTSVKMWDIIITNYLAKQNKVVPKRNVVVKERQIQGAFVKDPQVGLHKWVCSFDLNSLYPHLIMQYNISPDTLVGHCGVNYTIDDALNGAYQNHDVRTHIENGVAVAATGFMFRKDKRGFLPELMDSMYKDRKVYKGKMLEAKQLLEDIDRELESRSTK